MSTRNHEAEVDSRRGRSRRISDNEYEAYRPRILDLYLKQKRSREEIIEILAKEDGLRLSFKQLKHRLQKWNARKNIKRTPVAETSIYDLSDQKALTATETSQWIQQDIRNPDAKSTGPFLAMQLDPSGVAVDAYSHVYPPSHEHANTRSKVPGVAPSAGQTVQNGPNYDDNSNPMPFSDTSPRPPLSLRYASSKDEAFVSKKSFAIGGIDYPSTPFLSSAALIGSSNHTYEATTPHVHLNSRHFSFSPPHYTPPSYDPVVSPDAHQLSESSWSVKGQFSTVDNGSATSPPPCRQSRSPGDELLAFQTSSITPSPELNVVTSLDEIGLVPGDVDAKVLTHLSFGLNILCSDFQKYGSRWLTSRGLAGNEPCFSFLRDALGTGWVQKALNDILSDCCTAYQQSAKLDQVPDWDQNSPSQRFFGEHNSGPLQDTQRHALQTERPPVTDTRLNAVTLTAREDEKKDMIKLQLRTLSQTLSTGFVQDASTVLTLMSIPPARSRQLAAKFIVQKVLDITMQPRISRTLATFNVIPCDSEVIQHIRDNNVAGVQTLFSTRQAAPSDLDSDGRSLLSYAIQYRSLDIYKLLLENGSSREDVDSGLDVVTAIWGYYVLRNSDGDLLKETRDCVAMTRMALENDPSLTEVPMILGGLSVLNKAKRIKSSPIQPTIDFIVGSFDVEHKGPSGRTPLLCACTVNSLLTLKTLINLKANVHAVDDQGRGALHSALYSHSYLICPNDCGNSRHEAPHQCECPAAPIPHDCHYIHSWRECPRNNPSGLDETLLTLLQEGCNPTLPDNYGLSPSDYARRKPDLWDIWETALMMSGHRFGTFHDGCLPTW